MLMSATNFSASFSAKDDPMAHNPPIECSYTFEAEAGD